MSEWNRWLFSQMAAGHQPDPAWIGPARWMAENGSAIGIGALLVMLWVCRRQRGSLLLICVMACVATLAAHALADSFGIARPFVTGDSAAWIAHGGRGSFPSAHASVMFTVALGLWFIVRLRLPAIAFALLGIVTAWARIYGGLHYPMDIVGGIPVAATLVGGVRFMQTKVAARVARHAGMTRLRRRWRAAWPLRRNTAR